MKGETLEAGADAVARRSRSGSVVLFVLFVCLAMGLCTQIVCAVAMCGQQALREEKRGRDLARVRADGISFLEKEALAVWAPRPWFEVGSGETKAFGRLAEVEGGEDWVLGADVIQDEAVTDLGTSAWLERGRDGVDVPHAMLVAWSVHVDPNRLVPWLTRENPAEQVEAAAQVRIEAVGYVGVTSETPQIGEGCRLAGMNEPWTLGEGWRGLGEGSCRLCEGVFVVAGGEGEKVCLPQSLPATSKDAPVLVVVTGGADLDARGAGSVYGVLVVDGGSLQLEGTIMHGAVMVTGDVDFGLTGQVDLCSSVVEWATDRSLVRVRAVPGTLREGTQ